MAYLEALEREMELTVKQHPPETVETIFVGGGTPTVLTPEQMSYFLHTVHTYFPNKANDLEFSMEANPGTTDLEKLHAMKEGGVNRISFGVQSFDNGLLHAIGRIHSTDEVYQSLENARKAGFSNLSIDLMFGLPKQTVEQVRDSVTAALGLELPHYSLYSLKVEENTLFHSLYQKGKLPLPDEDAELEMYQHIMGRLIDAGYQHYEISNFAKPGFESRHNSMYWKNRAYYGLGAGAHGYIERQRHVNIKGIQPYIDATKQGLPVLEQFDISREEAMEDFMMVGLRLLEGVCEADFERQFDCSFESVFAPVLERLLQQELIQKSPEGYRLTPRGLLYGNDVFAAFLG